MRDLYRALGLRDAAADRAAIERAIAQRELDPELHETASFVLLNPVRKARYDWILHRAQELSEARTRLALPVNAPIDARPGPPKRMGSTPRAMPPDRRSPHSWAGWSIAAALLLMVGMGWAGLRFNRPPAERPREGSTSPVSTSPQGNGPSDNSPTAASPGEQEAQIPPEHGWLQLNPEVQPSRPWKIETDAGQDYLLTLVDSKTQATVMTLYLRGGEPYEGQVPVGVFEIAYTTGTRWLGFQNAFGHGSKRVQPALTYRVFAGAGAIGSWTLKLHPTSCEGIPIPPPVSVTSDPPAAPGVPGSSL